MGAIHFVFHVLNFCQSDLQNRNLCCSSKSMMKHRQNLDWIWTFPNLVMVIGCACLLITLSNMYFYGSLILINQITHVYLSHLYHAHTTRACRCSLAVVGVPLDRRTSSLSNSKLLLSIRIVRPTQINLIGCNPSTCPLMAHLHLLVQATSEQFLTSPVPSNSSHWPNQL